MLLRMLKVPNILVSRKESICKRLVPFAAVALVTSAIADSILVAASLMFFSPSVLRPIY